MYPAYLVVDLSFGDSGKGTSTEYLARATGCKLVVRASGASQCGHNIVRSDGTHHCFSQFNSGSFSGAKTYYSRFALLEPYALMNEAKVLAPKLGRDPLKDFYVEEGSIVITPYHWRANRLRCAGTSSSCGMGVGEARQDQLDNEPFITIGELKHWSYDNVYGKLRYIRHLKARQLAQSGIDPSSLMDESLFSLCYFYESFAKKINVVENGHLKHMIDGPIVVEGNQGVLLDEIHGFAPFNTWTDCTFKNALRVLDGIDVKPIRLGVLRTYATRHGAGPFPTESSDINFPDHNIKNEWQGEFRQGYFDLVASRYAIKAVGGIDGLILTHMDRCAPGKIPVCWNYCDEGDDYIGSIDHPEEMSDSFTPNVVEDMSGSLIAKSLRVPLVIESHGPTFEDKVVVNSEILQLDNHPVALLA